MATKKFSLATLLFVLVLTATAQKINNPNRTGPMGIEINMRTGNLFLPRVDCYVPGRGIPIDISLYYNSALYDEQYQFGRGWTFNYGIFYSEDTSGSITIHWGEGREDLYTSKGSGQFQAPVGFFDSLSEYQPEQYRLRITDGTIFYFNNSVHKKISRIEDPNGNFLSFTYTDTLLTSLTNSSGQLVTFAYDKGLMTSMTDQTGTPARNYTYTYDDAGNLIKFTNPLGNSYEYEYIVNGPLKSVKDLNQNKVNIIYFPDLTVSELIGCNKRMSFQYDSTALVSYVTDYLSSGQNQVTQYEFKKHGENFWLSGISGNCCGFNMKFEFDENGNKTKQTDAQGQETKYTYDNRGNTLTITDPLGQIKKYSYSAAHNLPISYTDPKGFVTTMEYDSRHNLIKLTEPGNKVSTATYQSNGDLLTSTDPNGRTINYSYDGLGHPNLISTSLGFKAGLNFDGHGNLISLSDSRNNLNVFEYDILDRLKKYTDPLNQQTTFSYDAAGNTTSITDEKNRTRFKSYDASNRLVQQTDQTGRKFYAGYDEVDNLTSITDPSGNSKLLGYNSRSQLNKTNDAEGNQTLAEYDGNGRLISISTPNGQIFTYSYDAAGKLTRVNDQNGVLYEYSYDKNDNIVGYKNALGVLYAATYDSSNRIKSVTDPLGNAMNILYDKNDNVLSMTNRNGQTSNMTVDSLNRIKTITDENGFTVTASYDVQGNLSSLTDQNNQTTNYTYDNIDRMKRTTYPDGRYIENTYDEVGNIIAKRLADGTNIQFTYDSLDRLTSKTLPSGQVIQFAYDESNRIISATNNEGTLVLTYDAMSRVSSETFNGRKVSYQYDVKGRTQTTIYPDSTIIVKNFNERNQLVSIARNNSPVISYQYNSLGRPIQKRFGNGVTTDLQYDFANRLSLLSTNSSIQQNTYSYNNEFHFTNINRGQQKEQFTYDNGKRLNNYSKGPLSGNPLFQNTYTYDAVGNRVSAQLNGVTHTYTPNNLNRITQYNNGVQTIALTYDGNGNLSFDGKYYKTYDAEGRLIKDSASLSNIITYGYDAFNRRIRKTLNGTNLLYTFSGLQSIEERSNAGVVLNKTIFSHFLTPIASEKSGSVFYYHQNENNSVEAITNTQGRLLEKYEYDVYGKMTIFDSLNNTISGSLIGNRFGFTGQVYDSATGNYKFHYREYNPTLGIFNQPDPLGYEDGMGMYQYVHNNPANGIDILGLKCPEDLIVRHPGRAEKISRFINFWNNHFGNIHNLVSTSQLSKFNSKFADDKRFKSLNYLSSVTNLATSIDLLQRDAPNLTEEEFNIRGAEIEASMAYLAADAAMDAGGGKTPAAPLLITTQYIGKLDALSQELTNKSLSRRYAELDDRAQQLGRDMALKMPGNQRRFDRHEKLLRHISKKYGTDRSKWRDEWKEIDELHRKAYDVGFRYSKEDCPENGHGGSRKKLKGLSPFFSVIAEILNSLDPNEIIGPDGVGEKKWVSINDRLPYTINYENDKSATAPAKYVKIIAPIPSKIDPASFQLGSFGFNNLTFTIPAGTASFYQRLDCRDSLNLYVDITAGYDQIKGEVFWEIQSIDPVTLLPPADPLKGFLLRQDSLNTYYGHGFVNFSVKPVSTAHTLDSVLANADIIFDSNDTIPTNTYKNTIDAVAPTSNLQSLVKSTPNTEVVLHFTGTDDPQGSGVKFYSIYVSDNNSNPELYVADFGGTDTSFIGLAGHAYKFYLSATDSAGNKEILKLIDSTQIISGETKICPGGTTAFDSRMTGFSYQWQVNTGNGFVNIVNNSLYSGANTSVLTLNNAPTNLYGAVYRCVVNGFRHSNVFLLKFELSWNGDISTQWENPANWSCNSLPDENTDVVITGGKQNYPVLNTNVTIRQLRLNNGATATVNAGFILTLKK